MPVGYCTLRELRGGRGMPDQCAQVVEVLLIESAFGELATLPLGDELLRCQKLRPPSNAFGFCRQCQATDSQR